MGFPRTTAAVLALLALVSCGDESDPGPPAPAPPAGGGAADAGAPARPRSLLVRPLYLGDAPPETRAAAMILLVHDESAEASATIERPKAEARRIAEGLVQQLRAGADVAALARRFSADDSARQGGVWGTWSPGVLARPLDEFLFSAELGEVSDPLDLEKGFFVLQRIESEAACRTIMVAGTGADERARCDELRRRALAGEDFAELAREHSDDEVTAARGGALAIFERTRSDALLRAAAFLTPVGEVSEPIGSPLGWHLVQRVPVDALDPSLREDTWARARLILVSYFGADGAPKSLARTPGEAHAIAQRAWERLVAGEDPAAVAAELGEDPLTPDGDVGWIHRRSFQKPEFLDALFRLGPGETLEPMNCTAGWVVLHRER